MASMMLRVILQQIVNQRAAAGLFLRQKLVHLIQTLPGEMQVQLHALIRLLHIAHLVGFVGGEKIAIGLRRPGRPAQT